MAWFSDLEGIFPLWQGVTLWVRAQGATKIGVVVTPEGFYLCTSTVLETWSCPNFSQTSSEHLARTLLSAKVLNALGGEKRKTEWCKVIAQAAELIVHACLLTCFSCVRLCVTLWTVHCPALFMSFSRQEYWSGLPCPPIGDLPDPGMEPASPVVSYIAVKMEFKPRQPSSDLCCVAIARAGVIRLSSLSATHMFS